LPILLGSYIDEDNEYWELILLMREICNIVFSFVNRKSDAEVLKSLIKTHHSLYLRLFNESNLKPKHHFLLHYPETLKSYGGFRNLHAFRFEAKHRISKIISSSTSSRINLPYTVALKHQLGLMSLFSGNTFCQDILVKGRAIPFSNLKFTECEFNKILTKINNTPKFCYSSLTFNGITYKTGNLVMLKFDENKGYPVFLNIKTMLIVDQDEIIIVGYENECTSFDRHRFAYVLGTGSNNMIVTSFNDLLEISCYQMCTKFEKNYIVGFM
jgi:hypothetical protein